MTFSVGMEVECIDDSPDYRGRPIKVVKGGRYTVSYVFDWNGQVGLLFFEIDPGLAPGWQAERFRPVIKRKTNIEVFQKMLNPSPEKALDDLIFDTLADIYLATKQWTS